MSDFTHLIYNWFSKNKRDLPWRKTSDPYKIWVSEIILQQTQVVQGLNYYIRFTERFPTVSDLANTSEDEVLNLWKGLGYYSRARNLHTAAKTIIEKYNGQFPNKYSEIKKLKGIGDYTAAAIASIAFNQPYPAVDGNVYRVLSRYFGISEPADSSAGKKKIYQIASELIQKNEPGMHNQAIMEFGALVCTPATPHCQQCPVSDTCFALQNNQTNDLPTKKKKIVQKNRFFNYFLIEYGDKIFLQKRSGNDIWKNLYQLPLIETKSLEDEKILFSGDAFQNLFSQCETTIHSIEPIITHILSHQKIHTRFISVKLNENKHFDLPFILINKKDISKFAVPKLIENYLQKKL